MSELAGKTAVIYGAGGAIGGAVARAFAREGARVFLTWRRLAPVEAVAKDIVSAGGVAEAVEVDALDEKAIDKHLQSIVAKAGRVDISFNAMGNSPDLQRISSYPFPATLGEFELQRHNYSVAHAYFSTALSLARDPMERRFLQRRIDVCTAGLE